MSFKIESEHLNGVVILKPDVYGDARGFFMESYNANDFKALGLPTNFQQDNHSRSAKDVLRGLHFQWDEPMGKLIRATQGSIMLVEVDIRPGSPTLGQHIMIELSDENKRIAWVPPGFANGFLVTSDIADVQYKCTVTYNPKCETGIRWNDPQLHIQWAISSPTLSAKDAVAQSLDEWLQRPEAEVFRYKSPSSEQ